MILQRIRIIVGDAGFEPGTSGALAMSHHISISVFKSVVNFFRLDKAYIFKFSLVFKAYK